MTSTNVCSQYATLNVGKLPTDFKKEFEEIKTSTNGFKNQDDEAKMYYENFGILYGIVKDQYPDALIKGAKAAPKKAATPKKATAKKAAPKKAATPKKAASKTATPKKATPKKAAPKKAATPKKATAKKAAPRKAATPKKATPKKATSPRKSKLTAKQKEANKLRRENTRLRAKIKFYKKETAYMQRTLKASSREKEKVNKMIVAYVKKQQLVNVAGIQDRLQKVNKELKLELAKVKERYMLFRRFMNADKRGFRKIIELTGGKIQLAEPKVEKGFLSKIFG